PYPRDDGGNRARIAGTQLQSQLVAAGVGADPDQAGVAVVDNHPAIAVRIDLLDAGDRTFAQEGQHRREIQRWTVRQPQYRLTCGGGGLPPQGTGRQAATAAEGAVEAAQAVET